MGNQVDLFSRQVVGWAVDDHMRTSLCVRALQMAFWRKQPVPGVLHHSDRGSQYASYEYRLHLYLLGRTNYLEISKVSNHALAINIKGNAHLAWVPVRS